MAREVPQWQGNTDDTPPSAACKRRILARQDHRCAITGKPFTAKEKPEFDHIVPLWLGGKNCEANLHAIMRDPHKAKSKTEAAVRAKIDAQTNAHFGLSNVKKQKIQSAGFPKRVARLPKPPVKNNSPIYRAAIAREASHG